jgi:hypothetical protein
MLMKCVTEACLIDRDISTNLSAPNLSAPKQTRDEFRCEFLIIFQTELMNSLIDVSRNGLSLEYLNRNFAENEQETIIVNSKPVDQILGLQQPKVLFGDSSVLASISKEEYLLCVVAFNPKSIKSVKHRIADLLDYYIAEAVIAFRLFYLKIRCMCFESVEVRQSCSKSMWDYLETMLRGFRIKTNTAAVNEWLIDEDVQRYLSQCLIPEDNLLKYRVPTDASLNGGNIE